jgi:hypothetical protein
VPINPHSSQRRHTELLPHVPHLESYPHHHGPLNVVHLGEGRPLAAGTDVPDNGLDPMVTMVLVQGGRAAPPVKAAISVDPAAGASVPIWALSTIRGCHHRAPVGARLPTVLPALVLPPSPA